MFNKNQFKKRFNCGRHLLIRVRALKKANYLQSSQNKRQFLMDIKGDGFTTVWVCLPMALEELHA